MTSPRNNNNNNNNNTKKKSPRNGGERPHLDCEKYVLVTSILDLTDIKKVAMAALVSFCFLFFCFLFVFLFFVFCFVVLFCFFVLFFLFCFFVLFFCFVFIFFKNHSFFPFCCFLPPNNNNNNNNNNRILRIFFLKSGLRPCPQGKDKEEKSTLPFFFSSSPSSFLSFLLSFFLSLPSVFSLS